MFLLFQNNKARLHMSFFSSLELTTTALGEKVWLTIFFQIHMIFFFTDTI
jgi:hypothetical protein